MAIGTVAELKTWLGVTGSGDDTLLTRLLSAAQAKLERIAGRVFEAANYAPETLSGDGYPSIRVKNPPINTLTSVVTIASDGTESTVDSDDYRFDANTGIIRFIGARPTRLGSDWEGEPFASAFLGFSPKFYEEFRSIEVTYNGGYSTVPEDLEQAVYEIAGLMYRDAKRDTTVQSESLGDYSYTLASGGSEEREKKIRAIAAPWRVVDV